VSELTPPQKVVSEPATFDSTRAHAALEWALERFTSIGVRLAPGNRLEKARSLLAGLNDGSIVLDLENQDTLDRLRDVMLTAYDHLVIAHVTPIPCTNEQLRRLQMSVAGNEVEKSDQHPHARNMQFELSVGAALVLGGKTARFAEPDYRMLYHGRTVGVAAKRIRGAGSLTDRLKDAVCQIQRSGLRGFVAIGADRITVQSPTGEKGRPIETVVPDAAQIDAMLRTKAEVLGRLLILREIAWVRNTPKPQIVLGHRYHAQCFTDSAEAVRQAEEFFGDLFARMRESLRSMQLAA